MDSPWAKRRNSSIERNANTRERTNVVESETNVARKPRTISCTRLYSPAVRTSTLSRMDSKRVVGRYPCIMIISHLDTLNPAPCHGPVASCTIFFCLALFHPARRQSSSPAHIHRVLPSSDPTRLQPSSTFYQRLKNPLLRREQTRRCSSTPGSRNSILPRRLAPVFDGSRMDQEATFYPRSTVLQLFTGFPSPPFPRID